MWEKILLPPENMGIGKSSEKSVRLSATSMAACRQVNNKQTTHTHVILMC